MKKFELLGKRLSKGQQKLFKGGDGVEELSDGSGPICLGCTEDYDCARVNKGKCTNSTCGNKTAKFCDMS